MAEETAWEILGVSEDADEETVKAAYKKMALLYHPDRNPERDTTREFLRVRKAFEQLSGRTRCLPEDEVGIDFGVGIAAILSNFVMMNMFHVFVSLEDIFSGEEREFVLEGEGPCFFCVGMGKRVPNVLCEMCLGTCRLTGISCENCFGDGTIKKKERTCEFCLGKGKRKEEKRLLLNLDHNLRDGQKYGLSGCASLVQIHLAKHETFQRINIKDLEMRQEIVENKTQKFSVKFLDGNDLKFFVKKEQAKKGKRLLLKGKGLQGGNLYVVLS
ncbi:chaperone protein DnaJ [Insectomime virus]|uniref:Chaperone protein DnaJ n=1 Tax=Tunisvirus fontaine2 TaxID=1421067 RepID=V9SF12_9VIRU|nr:chaperone protein DnaJ [Tunisvirus fontaine2]AHA46031.1 chaperone protein DnaJ [Insectomime virus]AHC54906.1 chaperone protein DnaJ [Tunisvirus fontaine2]